jgi:TRAP-type C4-dicarboxylate transport system permease small subunit
MGAGIFLAAVGAILRYATNIHVKGLSIDTVGLILMIAGAVIFVIALLQELFWRDRHRGDPAALEERREVREPPRY